MRFDALPCARRPETRVGSGKACCAYKITCMLRLLGPACVSANRDDGHKRHLRASLCVIDTAHEYGKIAAAFLLLLLQKVRPCGAYEARCTQTLLQNTGESSSHRQPLGNIYDTQMRPFLNF